MTPNQELVDLETQHANHVAAYNELRAEQPDGDWVIEIAQDLLEEEREIAALRASLGMVPSRPENTPLAMLEFTAVEDIVCLPDNERAITT